MLLEGKNAVVYGGGGHVGGAIARAFAREGAKVHLAGRGLPRLEEVARQIRAAGGGVEVARLDALDEARVDEHADAVAAGSGSLDVSVNAISLGDVQGTPLAGMTLADFVRPIDTAVRSTFLTARAAARHMARQRSGVILTFGGGGGSPPVRDYSIGGFHVAVGAIDVLRRQLAAELGGHGVRVLTLHSGGLPETFDDAEIADGIRAGTMLGRAATLDDVGRVAAFAASDLARTMTGTSLNITCGAETD
ncbi:SDR family NAD(P)-dependent oxidoreductase [Actinomadura fibrosa]|uniref:SDR family NAD(P)-dependent oxidoreductase n=1 Tax=Actinomadura fibrosa TaxID=111802 RepID=A0ABW2Y794_9ACTN|nr:SDR family oxidoreductase [Actinomadura fibrosa]